VKRGAKYLACGFTAGSLLTKANGRIRTDNRRFTKPEIMLKNQSKARFFSLDVGD